MDYRSWINRRIEARSRVVVLMKEYFFADQKYSKVAMKMASWLSKIIHEGKKCWPNMEEWEVCDWICKQTKDDMMEMIKHPDDRPMKGQSQLAKELASFLPTEGNNADQIATPLLDGLQRAVRPST